MADLTIITGASAGIGADMARECAKRGWDLALVARRRDRLEALAAELRAAHGVTIVVQEADLTDAAACSGLIEALAADGHNIDGLINNAGFGQRGAVADISPERQTSMIDLNVRALTDLTVRVLPAMKARGKGRILNVASTAAFQPGPYMAVYYATKAYVLSFTEALHQELKGTGIKVSALCPGPTRSEFAEAADMNTAALFKTPLTADSSAVAADAIAGLEKNAAVNVSGMANAAMAASIRFTPRPLVRRLVAALQK